MIKNKIKILNFVEKNHGFQKQIDLQSQSIYVDKKIWKKIDIF